MELIKITNENKLSPQKEYLVRFFFRNNWNIACWYDHVFYIGKVPHPFDEFAEIYELP